MASDLTRRRFLFYAAASVSAPFLAKLAEQHAGVTELAQLSDEQLDEMVRNLYQDGTEGPEAVGPMFVALLAGGRELPVGRVQVTFEPASGGYISNAEPLEWRGFEYAAAIDGWRLVDSEGQQVLDEGLLQRPVVVVRGDSLRIQPGELGVELD